MRRAAVCFMASVLILSAPAFCQDDRFDRSGDPDGKQFRNRQRLHDDGMRGEEEMEEMEFKIQELFEKSELLNRKGRHEEAEKVRRKGERLAGELRAIMLKRMEMRLKKTQAQMKTLRDMAEDADMLGEGERADRFRAEAKALEHWLSEARGNFEAAMMEMEFRKLFEKAEQLEREERWEEADETRARAEELVQEFKQRGRMMEERRHEEIEMEIDRLHDMLDEAEDRGDGEEADYLRAEIHELTMMFERRTVSMEFENEIEEMEAEAAALHRKAEAVEAEGEHERAHDLYKEAEEVHREIEEKYREQERRHLEMEAQHLYVEADAAKAKGRDEEAEELFRMAVKMERELQTRYDRRGHREEEEDEDEEEWEEDEEEALEDVLIHEIEKLHQEIRMLREEVERLKKQPRRERDGG